MFVYHIVCLFTARAEVISPTPWLLPGTLPPLHQDEDSVVRKCLEIFLIIYLCVIICQHQGELMTNTLLCQVRGAFQKKMSPKVEKVHNFPPPLG